MNKTLNSFVGICADKNWDAFVGSDKEHPASFFKLIRHFLHMEDLYAYPSGNIAYGPSDYPLSIDIPGGKKIIDFDFCDQSNGLKACEHKAWSGLNDTWMRYGEWYPKGEVMNIFALASLVWPPSERPPTFRSFPAKHMPTAKWGSSLEEIADNADKLLTVLDTYFGFITHVEINEFYMQDRRAEYIAIMNGFMRRERRIKILTTSVQVVDADKGGDLYYNYIAMLNTNQLANADGICSHPYGFLSGAQGNDPNALADKPENNMYNEVKALDSWLASNSYQQNIDVTELGWNSNAIGEDMHKSYMVRSMFLLMSIQRCRSAFIYELIDRPNDPVFNSTGLLYSDLTHKEAYTHLKFLMQNYGDYKFEFIENVAKDWTACISKDSERLFVEWNEDAADISYTKKQSDTSGTIDADVEQPADLIKLEMYMEKGYIEDVLKTLNK